MSLSRSMKTSTERLPTMAIKVISVVETKRVTRWEMEGGEPKPHQIHINKLAAVSDGKIVMKLVLFTNLASEVKEGKSYLIKNYGLNTYGAQKSMLSKRQTALYICAPVAVPADLEEEARGLISPPSPLTPFSNMKCTDGMVSVQGCVSFMGAFEMYPVQQQCPVPVRNIMIREEDGSKIHVALWREANLTTLEMGMPVRITHLRVKLSEKHGYTLSSTNHTNIEVAHVHRVAALGMRELPNGDIEVLDEKDIEVVIPGPIWHNAFSLPVTPPLNLILTYNDGIITNISAE